MLGSGGLAGTGVVNKVCVLTIQEANKVIHKKLD